MKSEIITTAPDQYKLMLDDYASIVEKTNNQLGLSISASSLAVAVLSAFIAVLAIVVAYYIWKNSKEQKDLFKNFLIESKKNIDEQYNIMIEQKNTELTRVIQEFEKAKDSVTGEKKIELEKVINEYKAEKEKLKPVKTFSTDQYYSTAFSRERSMFCGSCGNSFKYISEKNPFSGQSFNLYMTNEKVICPHCGKENIAQ